MTTRNRHHLPHPALSPYGSDYQEHCRFHSEPRAIRVHQGQEIVIALEHRLECASLQQLVEQGKAGYLVLTDGVATRQRESHQSRQPNQTITLDATAYCGAVRLKPYVVALEPLAAWSSPDWRENIKVALPDGADLPQSAILALGHECRFDTKDAKEMHSIMQLAVSNQAQAGMFDLDLDNEQIVIKVDATGRNEIDRIRHTEGWQDAMWLTYLNAMVEAVRQHQNADYGHRRWARVIAAALTANELDASDREVVQAQAYRYAQIIMQKPLQRFIEAAQNAGTDTDE